MTHDPDWWQPVTDDYIGTYDEARCPAAPDDNAPDDNAITLGEVYADADTAIRFGIERGRPGYIHPDDV